MIASWRQSSALPEDSKPSPTERPPRSAQYPAALRPEPCPGLAPELLPLLSRWLQQPSWEEIEQTVCQMTTVGVRALSGLEPAIPIQEGQSLPYGFLLKFFLTRTSFFQRQVGIRHLLELQTLARWRLLVQHRPLL